MTKSAEVANEPAIPDELNYVDDRDPGIRRKEKRGG
jgi:hypothetical protein